MRVLLVDLTPTTPIYDAYLFEGLSKRSDAWAAIGYSPEIEDLPVRKALEGRTICVGGLTRTLSRFGQVGKGLAHIWEWKRLLRVAPEFDVIHIEWLPLLKYSSLELVYIERLLKRNPHVVYTVHNILPHNNKAPEVAARYRKLYRLLPRLIVHAERTKQELVAEYGVDGEKIHVVPHGAIFYDCFKPEHENSGVIAMIGHMQPYKGVLDAVRAMAILRDQHGGDVRLLLAGNGPQDYLEQIRVEIKRLGIESQVDMMPRHLSVAEIIDLHTKADAVLLPYSTISQSGAAITALTLGVPIVAYDVGGLATTIDDGVTGFVVPKGDVGGLAEGAWKAMHFSAQLRRECHERVLSRFSWDLVAGNTLDVYGRGW